MVNLHRSERVDPMAKTNFNRAYLAFVLVLPAGSKALPWNPLNRRLCLSFLKVFTRKLLFGLMPICFVTSLVAQEVEVIGDRKELQKVFDAYDRLRVSLESYDASVEGVIEMDKRVVKGKYDISKRGSLYSVSTVSQNIPSEGTPPIDIAHEHYLDSSRGYHEEVDARKGVIRIFGDLGDESNPVDSRWSPLKSPFHAPLDRECSWFGMPNPFRPTFDPETMKGTTRQLTIEKKTNGDIVLVRKLPSERKIEAIASAEFGHLLVSIHSNIGTDERMEQVKYAWSKLPNGNCVPKSRAYLLDSTKVHLAQSWEVTRLTTPGPKKDIVQPSLNPPVGWKIIDASPKANSEFVIGEEEGKHVRGLLDSVKRVRAEVVFAGPLDGLNARVPNFGVGADDKTKKLSGVDCIFLAEKHFEKGNGDYAQLIREMGKIPQAGMSMDEISKRLKSSGLACQAVTKAVASDIWPEIEKAKGDLVVVGHVSPHHFVIVRQPFGEKLFLVVDPCVVRSTIIDQASFSGNFLIVSKNAIPISFPNN